MLPRHASPTTLQRTPCAPRSVNTRRARSGQSSRQVAGSANSAASRSGGTARNVSSTTSTVATRPAWQDPAARGTEGEMSGYQEVEPATMVTADAARRAGQEWSEMQQYAEPATAK